jgi:hypothetical protein
VGRLLQLLIALPQRLARFLQPMVAVNDSLPARW